MTEQIIPPTPPITPDPIILRLSQEQKDFRDELKQSIIAWFDEIPEENVFLYNHKNMYSRGVLILYRLMGIGLGSKEHHLSALGILAAVELGHTEEIWKECRELHQNLIKTDREYQKDFAVIALRALPHMLEKRVPFSEANFQALHDGKLPDHLLYQM